jgi:hypothetical protein
MATVIRNVGPVWTGLGFTGSEFTGVGGTGGVCADSVVTIESANPSVSLHGPIYDTVLITDNAVLVSATHCGGYGAGTAFTGLGMLQYAFTAMGTAGTYLNSTLSDRLIVWDVAS